MRRLPEILRWLDSVAEGEPLSVGIAVVMGAAILGFVVLGVKIGMTKESVPPMRKKRLRWPEDAPDTKKPDAS